MRPHVPIGFRVITLSCMNLMKTINNSGGVVPGGGTEGE